MPWQVEKIKEQARYIADLPEVEFNALVVNARDYSLARGRPPPPPPRPSAMSTGGQHALDDRSSDDDDDGRVRRVPQLNFHNPSAFTHKGNAAGMTDDDSGLPSSTRSGRRNSLPSSEDDAEMQEKGKFRYSQPFVKPSPKKDRKREEDEGGEEEEEGEEQEQEEEEKKSSPVPRLRVSESVVVTPMYNPQYDEAVMVEHDNESVESPRSDTSSTREYDVTQLDGDDLGCGGGTELTTFSSEQHGYYDDDDDDDDEGGSGENVHRALYGRHSLPSAWVQERPRSASASSIHFKRSAKGHTISSLRNSSCGGGAATGAAANASSVDDSVQFPSLSGHHHSTQARLSPDCSSAVAWSRSQLSPPFGTDTENVLRRVGNSISSMVQSSSYNLSKLDTGTGAGDRDGTPGDSKKKKKKKKDTKGKFFAARRKALLFKLQLGFF